MPEPKPTTRIEEEALTRPCRACFADPGTWCATTAARNDYVTKLHAARLVAAPGDPKETRP